MEIVTSGSSFFAISLLCHIKQFQSANGLKIRKCLLVWKILCTFAPSSSTKLLKELQGRLNSQAAFALPKDSKHQHKSNRCGIT
jgi:hypothetical protein